MTPLQHLELLLRFDRSLNLRASLVEAVTPGARVLDAGCGVGLLSLWAAQAGAGEVIGVDFAGVALAEALAKENGADDVIRFVEGDLAALDLSEHEAAFDVVLAMIYLNDPRRDAYQSGLVYRLRDRYLAAGGVMIPDRVRYTVRACEWPSQDHPTRVARLREQAAELEGRYGLSFRALGEAVAAEPWKSLFPPRSPNGRLDMEGVRVLSPESLFAEVDYTAAQRPYPEEFRLQMDAAGVCTTLVWRQELWFRGRLLFSNDSVSWIRQPVRVDAGMRCSVRTGDHWRRLNVADLIPDGGP